MFSELQEALGQHKNIDVEFLRKVYKFAEKAHEGQIRKSGDPYISHPIQVAKILVDLGMDQKMVAAAILHDVVEDTEYTIEDIAERFGSEVAVLVKGVTNLGTVDFSTYSTDDAEEAKAKLKNDNLRRLFLAMAEDARVVIIKLADRLHNMRTIKVLAKKDQIRIAKETLNIFAPLALRLGMGEIKGELEDLAFPIAFPEEYKYLKKEANRRYKAADRYVIGIKREISDRLKKEKIDAGINGRAKHIYSLYKKITRPEISWDFDKIYDLVALRIITDTPENCYRIMGLIHGMYRPMPNYIRDYIAAPKPNGYRSIHTSVFGPDGKIVEIQIRTYEMHEEAEFGIASHLHYTEAKSQGASDAKLSKGTFAKKSSTDFLKQIKAWQEDVANADEFVEGLKFEFLDDRIYAFSPKGDIYDLPVGATPIDFAYEVHSGVGDMCTGAKVNGRIVPLDSQLATRDVVEIITQKSAHPKRGWLDIVITAKAKQHIRAYFRRSDYDNNRTEGERTVAEELDILGYSVKEFTEQQIKEALSETSFKSLDDMYASVGAGITTPRQAVRIILGKSYSAVFTQEKTSTSKKKEPSKTDFKGLKIFIAPCCEPKKTDKVICYVTRGRGLAVHRADCTNVSSLEERRVFKYNPWKKEKIKINIEITAKNRVGMLRDITKIISDSKVNIETITNHHLGKVSIIDVTLGLEEISQASSVIKKLKEVKDVEGVKRTQKMPLENK